MKAFTSLLSKLRPAPARPTLPRVAWPRAPERVYAIGDIHGCLEQLNALEALIVEDARDVAGDKYLIFLGDYVDRGPKSAQVLDHLLAPPPPGFGRICLRGNHEDMMLRAAVEGTGVADWLSFGGEETMQSYGVPPASAALSRERRSVQLQVLEAHVPREHLAFLASLPVALEMPGYAFVHAGVRPGLMLAQQRDDDLMWIRDEFVTAAGAFGATIVHGHTPAARPLLLPNRIAVDTGCYQTGCLSAVRISSHEPIGFLEAR